MPDLREVFEMTTKQMEPDLDAWREQEKLQRRSSRNKKLGAFAVAAAIGLGAVVFVLANQGDPNPDEKVVVSTPSSTTPLITGAFLLDLGSGDAAQLPDAIDDGSIYSTTGGTLLAYSLCCSSPNPVYVANVDGSGFRQITREGVDGFGAALSPDGSMLVYQRRDGASSEIGNLVLVDLATGDETQVTDLEPASYGAWFLNPSFSPDGARIVFQLPRGPDDGQRTRWDLWSVAVSGGEASLEVADASMPAYATDGRLAYVDAPRGSWSSSRLMVRDADGGTTVLLEVEGGTMEFPRWSPDGTMIAVQGGDPSIGTMDSSIPISVVDVSTGDVTVVGSGEKPAWLDDDTLLIVR